MGKWGAENMSAASNTGITEALPAMYLLKWCAGLFFTMLPGVAAMWAIIGINQCALNEHSRPCVCIFGRKIILQVGHAGSHDQQWSSVFQNLALTRIGLTNLPQGTFEFEAMLSFAGYSFTTSMRKNTCTLFFSKFDGKCPHRDVHNIALFFLPALSLSTIDRNISSK